MTRWYDDDGVRFAYPESWELSREEDAGEVRLSVSNDGTSFWSLTLLPGGPPAIEVVETACELAVEQNTLRLPAITNLINQLVEPIITPLNEGNVYPQLTVRPEADCKRYEALCSAEEAAA